MKTLIMAGVIVATLFVAGCIDTVDPVTGEQLIRVEPNTAKLLDNIAYVAEAAQPTGGALAVFWPVAGLITGIAGGLAGMWKKLKPKVVEAQKEADLYYATTASVVEAIEEFKKAYPDDWDNLEIRLEKAIGRKTEAVIRALRGMPEKV